MTGPSRGVRSRHALPGPHRALLLVGVIVVALNLRGAIAAVSPVLPEIRVDLQLSGFAAGLLTTLPVLCFAVIAPVAAWLGRRVRPETAILLACLAIAAATVVRVLGGSLVLLAGSLLVGVTITVGNVLMPVVIKRDFPHRAAAVTGVYTASLIAGAAATAALTAPMAALTSWRVGLAAWAFLAVAAAVIWWVATRGWPRSNHSQAVVAGELGRRGVVWRHPVAWAVALLFGFQSVVYFSLTAWLPTLLVDELGIALATAGLGMSVFQVLGIAGTVVVATLARRRPRQAWLAVLVASAFAVMLIGLLLWPAGWPLWTVVGGVAQGAGITLALTLVVFRAADSVVAGQLSGMAQLVAYTMGAAGPVVVGVLHEFTGGWVAPLWLLLVVVAAIAIAGLFAGRDVTVEGSPPAARS
jgi:CP family cyanate transporter-like MFS transporter